MKEGEWRGMATAFKQKNFRIPLELAEKLEEAAKETGLTETEIVIKALQAYLERGEGNVGKD